MHAIKLNYTTGCQSKLRYETGKPSTLKPHHTYNILPSVCIPHNSTCTYFPELACLPTLKPHHHTTFYPVYTQSPKHYSMASLQHYEHF